LTKEDMGHIMVDWDEEWKTRLAEAEPSEKKTQNSMRFMMKEKKEIHRKKEMVPVKQPNRKHHTQRGRGKN
jgi:hypothetical protein